MPLKSNSGLRLEIDQFNAAMNAMKRMLGNSVTQQQIIESEVKAILSKTLARTKAASVRNIIDAKKEYPWATWNGKKYLLTNRYPDSLWGEINTFRKESLAKKLAARGWTKASWYYLGLKIGYDLPAPAFVKKAKVKNHLGPESVSAIKQTTRHGFGLTIENHSPLLRFDTTNGAKAFFSAIAGRIGHYKKTLALGVFNDVKKVAQAYPGLNITPK